MSRQTRKRIIAFALNAGAYGTDAIASAEPTTHLLGREFSINPLVGEDVPLDYDDGKGGNSAQLLVGNYVTISFTVDWAGSGTAATAPKYSKLLQACQCAEVVATDVRFNVDEDSSADLTFYFYHSGALHKVTGARGSFSLSANSKQVPGISFSFTGLFEPVTAQSLPVPNFAGWQQPLPVGHAFTSVTLGGVAVKHIEFSYDRANTVNHAEYSGHEEVEINDFAPTGSLMIQAPDIATLDVFDLAENATQQTLSLVHGPANNQVGWQGTVQLGRPEYGDKDGTATYTLPIRPLGTDAYLWSA